MELIVGDTPLMCTEVYTASEYAEPSSTTTRTLHVSPF